MSHFFVIDNIRMFFIRNNKIRPLLDLAEGPNSDYLRVETIIALFFIPHSRVKPLRPFSSFDLDGHSLLFYLVIEFGFLF